MLIAVFIVQMIAFSSTRSWGWTGLGTVRFLGRISYSLYLYQHLTLYSTRKALAAYPVIIQLAGAILVTIILATISYYVIERPFLRLNFTTLRLRKNFVPEVAAQ